MTLLKERYEISECIYKSSNSNISLALDNFTYKYVVLKSVNLNQHETSYLSMLQNEYRLLSVIESKYVAEIYDYINFNNNQYIVMEYCEGVTLRDYIKEQKMSVKEFLFIAREIVKGLSDIHKEGIIHKDINPSNIIFDPRNRKVKLIDFGISTEFSCEKPLYIDLTTVEGTLFYISPEQTGRTNSFIDFRTDFYSLGVTFFEMLCGCRPFEADSLTEIIYSHIAKLPPSANKMNASIPDMVSKIISKLMAKMPQDRYISAAGILFDLDKCLGLIDSNNEIMNFELGTGDYSDRFEIPNKLYGRGKEVSELLEAYDKIFKGGKTLITIGGYSGVGKTSLVSELNKSIANTNGIFISGKYDQYHKNAPFYALFAAIDHFCDMVLSENEKNLNIWRGKIKEALNEDGKLIIDMVKKLAVIAGEPQSMPNLSPVEERARFKAAIKRLMAVIASPQRPLVLFFDDMHHAATGSFELLEEIISHDDINGLMVIISYRENETDSGHPLYNSLNKMSSLNVDVKRLSVPGLDKTSISQMLADTFHRNESDAFELAEVVYNKTYGNPFYLKQFLRYCHTKGYISFANVETVWKWDIKAIAECPTEENVVDFLIKNMDQLPAEVIVLLSLGACIGKEFGVDILSELSGEEPEKIISEIKKAVQLEIIYPLKSRTGLVAETVFNFSHDRFQQSFYTIVAEGERSRIHYRLASYYEKKYSVNKDIKNENTDLQFIITDNYFKALSVIEDKDEKGKILEILFKAAHTASMISAFDIAFMYLEQIICNINDLQKNEDHFVFSVYKEYHSVLCSLARYDEADKIYGQLESLKKDPIKLADSCCLQAAAISNRGKYKEAFMLGAGLLETMGVYFPTNNLERIIKTEIDMYYNEIRKSNGLEINGGNEASDEREFAIGKLLNRICAAGFFYNPFYSFWVIITNARRIFLNGYTPDGLQLYSNLILMLIPLKNDFKLPYTEAVKAMKLAEKNRYKNELYRIYHVFSLFNCHWFEDIKNSIPYARESYKGNVAAGDFEFACFSYFTTQQAVLETSRNMKELDAEVASALDFAAKTGNRHAFGSYISYRQFCRALDGKTLTPGSFNDDSFNEEAHLAGISSNPMALCYFYTLRALSAVIYSDYVTAFELTQKAEPLMIAITGFYPVALHNFLHSLSICKRIESKTCKENEQMALLKKLEVNQKWLSERASDAPTNFSHLYKIIEAERKALYHQSLELMELYEEVIIEANKNNRTYHYAIICELAAQRLFSVNAVKTAASFLNEAYSAYHSWGAQGKIEQLKLKYNNFISLDQGNRTNIVERTNTTMNTTTTIDFDAIIEASQAISGEMRFETVLEKLITVLLENAGAQDVYYLAKKGQAYVIQAEGHSKDKSVQILHENIINKNIFPIKIINYTDRTKESVILDNAAQSDLYGSDEYILSRCCKSIMCLPVINNRELKGLLYFENNLIEGVFNEKRSEALKTIASQLAISLENCYLYNNLQRLVDERTRELRDEITTRKNAEKHLEYMANHDCLTNLPNRRMFNEILENSIKMAGKNNYTIAVLFVDLDGFKIINDVHGHDKGDIVLKSAARRLISSVRSCDTVSRMGGDEFVLILENVQRIDEIQTVANRIIESIGEPIRLDDIGTKAKVTASIGISILNSDGDTAEDLVTNSDKAMYKSKENGKNQYVLYSNLVQIE